MAIFRKKPVVPVVVEASQWFPIAPRPTPHMPDAFGVVWQYDVTGNPVGGTLQTLEGTFNVRPGDWIIPGDKGEKCVCNPDIFEATYEPVDEPTPPPASECGRPAD